jgi:hypothetical protein
MTRHRRPVCAHGHPRQLRLPNFDELAFDAGSQRRLIDFIAQSGKAPNSSSLARMIC